MLTTVIVEDEKKSRESFCCLLKQYCPNANTIGEVASVKEAIEVINKLHPQLVFLDVELRDGTGFDLLKQLDKINFKIIFVTAFSHYAIKAIRFSAIDYLLKPVDIDDLIEAVNKAENETHHNHQQHYNGFLNNLKHGENYKLALPVKDGVAFLAPEEIIRVEADSSYSHIYTNAGKYTAAKNIKEYEQLLSDYNFFRSHNSHLINLKHVKQFSRVDGFFAQMSDGSCAEISRRKKDEFMHLMNR